MGDKEFTYKTIADGRKAVTAAGTAEALVSASTLCRAVIIKAFSENTATVVVGASTVVAAASTRRGIGLQPNEAVMLRVEDLVNIYVDAETSGEGVGFVYFK